MGGEAGAGRQEWEGTWQDHKDHFQQKCPSAAGESPGPGPSSVSQQELQEPGSDPCGHSSVRGRLSWAHSPVHPVKSSLPQDIQELPVQSPGRRS